MTERPILFNDEMVRAILSGKKTQTRRPLKPQRRVTGYGCIGGQGFGFIAEDTFGDQKIIKCPLGQPGDELYVRECFCTWECDSCLVGPPMGTPSTCYCDKCIQYRADGIVGNGQWTPSIHMPRGASRITLTIKDIRVERLRDIDTEDAIAEGVNGGCCNCGENEPCGCDDPQPDLIDSFVYAWDKIYASRNLGWHDNPFVWICDFEVKNG